jgi:hypothetical protein
MAPKEFKQIYTDFVKDILTTFPELEGKIHVELETEEAVDAVFDHCKEIYPVRFFDILNKNAEIFDDGEVNTEFLPGVDFADLWHDEGLSDTTKEAIWKYLQLIMFAIIETIQTAESFGDTAKLFETMKEDDLKAKLEDTIKQMESMFSKMGSEKEGNEGESNTFNIDDSDLPDAEELHNHISGLMGGKLGQLANEIAQETMEEFDFGLDGENSDIKDVGDVFNKMFKNPGKLMNIVNNISGKLDSKMKSGDINEADLMKEATDLMGKMQNIPGLPNMGEMFKNMGQNMKNMSGAQRGAAQTKVNLDQKMSSQKERMRRKLEERRQFAEAQAQAQAQAQTQTQTNTVAEASGSISKPKKKKNNKKRK